MTDVLHAARVTKRFGGLVAVHDIEFTIPEGSIVSLIGPNGAGKTTFFNIIAGIYDPSAGEIIFRGKPMIAHARRAWLEPVMWVLPALAVGLVTFLLGQSGASSGLIALGILFTIISLMVVMVVGVARPAGYSELLMKLGIFRSARPNDMVVAGLGRTFQNIRLFQNMTALDNVLGGMHSRWRAPWLAALLPPPRVRAGEEPARQRAEELMTLVGLHGRSKEV